MKDKLSGTAIRRKEVTEKAAPSFVCERKGRQLASSCWWNGGSNFCVCYMKVPVCAIALSGPCWEHMCVCRHAHCLSSSVKGGGENCKRITTKDKVGHPHLHVSAGLFHHEGCFSWPDPSPEYQFSSSWSKESLVEIISSSEDPGKKW